MRAASFHPDLSRQHALLHAMQSGGRQTGSAWKAMQAAGGGAASRRAGRRAASRRAGKEWAAIPAV